MTPHREAFRLACEHLATSRKSTTRVLSGDALNRLALNRGGLKGAEWTEAAALDSLNTHRGAPGVQITWHAHTRQPDGDTERQKWCPGTPLPDQTAYVTCTASAPLQT
jgi:hypothetical protein